ncbi:MAG: VTT domain-containing protein [Lewinellaceae bacterium]|nr:VTT domain-containing protein [Lewinellaceae bacterium]
MMYIGQFFHGIRAWVAKDKHKEKSLFFNSYVWRLVGLYCLIIAVVFVAGSALTDLKPFFQALFGTFSDTRVLLTFFLSESLMGLLPIEFFMIWTNKFESPLLVLTFLGVISYLGGLISYGIGRRFAQYDWAKKLVERRLQKQIALTRKWGTPFIVVSAIFPFSPFSMVALVVGFLQYPFSKVLLWGLVRIPRFVLNGLTLHKLLDVNLW